MLLISFAILLVALVLVSLLVGVVYFSKLMILHHSVKWRSNCFSTYIFEIILKFILAFQEYQEWMDKFLHGLKTTPPVPECKDESDRVLYPGLYAHEVTQERLKNGIPYHKEVLFWYKCFAYAMKEKLEDKEDYIKTLIDIIETEFPSYEITHEEQDHWKSGVFSGVLGNKLQKSVTVDLLIIFTYLKANQVCLMVLSKTNQQANGKVKRKIQT